MAGTEGATATTNAGNATNTTERVVETVKKYIPGLIKESNGNSGANSKPAVKRSRTSKAKSSKKDGIASSEDPALATATLAEAPEKGELPDSLLAPAESEAPKERSFALNGNAGMTDGELAILAHKRFSPALTIQKRLRAHNKKLVGHI